MVRFQPPVASPVEDDSASDSHSSDGEEVHIAKRTPAAPAPSRRREDDMSASDSADDTDEDDAIELPLRGRTPQVAASARKQQQTRARLDDAEEEKYPTRAQHSQRKLHLDDSHLESEYGDEKDTLDEESVGSAETASAERSHFAASSTTKRVRAPAAPQSALKHFLASVKPYQRPSTIDQYLQGNPLLAPASAAAAPPAQRSMLDFLQHSFRAGWSHTGSTMFFATGLDGMQVTRAEVDPLAVDQSSQAAPLEGRLASKKALARAALETHLAFHSQDAVVPSSAKVFGRASAWEFAPATTFGAAAAALSQAPLTPFTRLCDAHINSIRNIQPATTGPSRSQQEEQDLALSTFQLLRVLYSKEEAEQRAPKLSRGAAQALAAERALTAASAPQEDLSIVTARDDAYALFVGRESAFEQGWLQPSVATSYVNPRVRLLKGQAATGAKGSDGLAGTHMQQVIARLIGHDLVAATDACIAGGNFRLATLLAQLNSCSSSGRLQPDGQPLSESSQRDIARQLALWNAKDRGMSEYIPRDVDTIYRLMSGDVLIEPSLAWIESLALHYWYTQPRTDHANVRRALINYKKHAFMGGQVRRPFAPYASYVPVAKRHGGGDAKSFVQPAADDDDDDAMGGGSSQALVVSLNTPPRSSVEYFDLRYGLLELYTEQSRTLDQVLTPQSHVPHVLDHHLAWHIFTLLQSTPIGDLDANLAALHMNYIHQLELLGDLTAAEDRDDFWKWAIYVALAAPFPNASDAFDREQIVKTILVRHVRYARDAPFALAAAGQSGLPTALPVLQVDSNDFFSLGVVQSATGTISPLAWGAAASIPPVEQFLLTRCQLPASWLYECKAVSAAYEHEYSVACFYYLHAGDVVEAYRIFHAHIMTPWILSVLHATEAAKAQVDAFATAPASSNDALEADLFALLRVFLPHASTLFGWSSSGGGLLLTYLEFRRNFVSNLRHFTQTDRSASLQTRYDNFRAYQNELQQFVRQIDALATTTTDSSDAAPGALARLTWSKMSGTVLQHLHALQPLEDEMRAQQREETGAAPEDTADASLTATAVELSQGALVASADRLAVLADWKDAWLQQYA